MVRKPKPAKKAAAKSKTAKPKPASRKIARVPAETDRSRLAKVAGERGETRKELASVVGRSQSLVSGWLTPGGSGQVKFSSPSDTVGRKTNPELAVDRLDDVLAKVAAYVKARDGKTAK
jgi:hypothetical protein